MSADVERFKVHVEQVSAARTAEGYARDAAEFEAFRQGRPLTIPLAEAFAATLNHGRLNPATVSRKLAALRSWLGYLGAHGDGEALTLAQTLKVYRITRGAREADRKPARSVTSEAYVAARGKAEPRVRVALDVLFWTGCRISELVGDSVAAIPFLTVRGGRELVIRGWTSTIGKGSKRRWLVMPRQGRILLAECGPEGEDGQPLIACSRFAVYAALRRLGLPSLHALRHGYRARLRQADVSEDMAAELLGHGPRTTTAGYGRPTAEELLAAVEQMEATR